MLQEYRNLQQQDLVLNVNDVGMETVTVVLWIRGREIRNGPKEIDLNRENHSTINVIDTRKSLVSTGTTDRSTATRQTIRMIQGETKDLTETSISKARGTILGPRNNGTVAAARTTTGNKEEAMTFKSIEAGLSLLVAMQIRGGLRTSRDQDKVADLIKLKHGMIRVLEIEKAKTEEVRGQMSGLHRPHKHQETGRVHHHVDLMPWTIQVFQVTLPPRPLATHRTTKLSFSISSSTNVNLATTMVDPIISNLNPDH